MQEKRQTLIADFAIQGRLAYLSHQETLTMFQRSLVRAGCPVAFSRGFNPRPRQSIILPRSVGTQSQAERICVILETDEQIDTEKMKHQLALQLPKDCCLLNVQCVEGKSSFYPRTVRYVFTLHDVIEEARKQYLSACQADVESGQRIEVQRYRAKRKICQPFDISPYVEYLKFSAAIIEVSCRVSQEGTVRIDELMQWLRLEVDQLKEPVYRSEVLWEKN